MKNTIVLVAFRVLFALLIPALLLVAGVKSVMKIIKGIREALGHSKGWRIYHLEKFLHQRTTQNHMHFLAVLVICLVLPPMAVVVAAVYLTNLSWLATVSARNQLKAMGLDPNEITDPNEVNKIIAKTISASLGEPDLEQDGVLIYTSGSAKSMLKGSGGAFYFPYDGKIRLSAECGAEVLAHEEGHKFFKHSSYNTFTGYDVACNEIMADMFSWWKIGKPAMKAYLWKELFGFSLFRTADDVWFHSLRILAFYALAPEVNKSKKVGVSLEHYAGENPSLIEAIKRLKEAGEYSVYSLDD